MNVLYLVHRIPYPPDKGDKIRSWRWLEHLANQHDVHLVALFDDPEDQRHEAKLRSVCASVTLVPVGGAATRARAMGALLSSQPLTVAWFRKRAAQRAVDEILARESIDLVFGFSSVMAEYVRNVSGVPRIMDMVDCDSAKFRTYQDYTSGLSRFVYGLEGRRLARYEEEVTRDFDAVILVTEPEADLLRSRVPNERVRAIANGVALPDRTRTEGPREAPRILFVGAMDYFANVDAVVFAAREIMPRVRAERPDATFDVVGHKPAPDVRKLADLPGVSVMGDVPDITPYLESAALSLVPLRIAQGIQNKVLEAMAWRLPTVTTPKIVESLGATAGEHLLAAESADELARHVLDLLADADRRREMGEAARTFVAASFSWDAACARLDRLIDEVVGRPVGAT